MKLFRAVAAALLIAASASSARAAPETERVEKAERALAKERKAIETAMSVLASGAARPEFPEKSRAAADKAREKLEAAFARLIQGEENLQTAKAAGAEAGKKAERVAQESGLRLLPVEITTADVKRLVGGAKAYAALAAGAQPEAGVKRAVEACEVALDADAGVSIELDARPSIALPAKVQLASGRHTVIVKLGSEVRTGTFMVLCGKTTKLRLGGS